MRSSLCGMTDALQPHPSSHLVGEAHHQHIGRCLQNSKQEESNNSNKMLKQITYALNKTKNKKCV